MQCNPQVHGLKRRYEVGLEKLLAAEQDVGAMKEELIALQPKLIETGKEVEETLKVRGGSRRGLGVRGGEAGRGEVARAGACGGLRLCQKESFVR